MIVGAAIFCAWLPVEANLAAAIQQLHAQALPLLLHNTPLQLLLGHLMKQLHTMICTERSTDISCHAAWCCMQVVAVRNQLVPRFSFASFLDHTEYDCGTLDATGS